jgi:transcriptional regulator with XRE-family HTH domain
MGLGQQLRELRKARGLTLERAAKSAGLSRSAVNRWETGVNQPRLPELNALLDALGADARQKREIIAQEEAPRAQLWVRDESTQVALKTGLDPQPHRGDLLRALRLRCGLPLEVLGERLGVTVRTLRRWEKGDLFPSVEHLHGFCYEVGAREEEVLALMCGVFPSLAPFHDTPPTYAELEEQFATLQSCFTKDDSLPIELLLLTLEAQVWELAARTDPGKSLLARTYHLHGLFLDLRGRYHEAGKYTESSLALLPRSTPLTRQGLHAVLVNAGALSASGRRHASRYALEQLRPYLSITPWMDMQAWLLAQIAANLTQEGRVEEGLALSRKAVQIAEKCDMPGERERRYFSHGELLLEIGRPGEALELLAGIQPDNPYFDAHLTLSQGEAYAAVRDSSAAQERLTRFEELLQSYSLQALSSRAAKLAQHI